MIALLTDRPTFRAKSLADRKYARAAFSAEIWELHHIIADPVSRSGDVKMAKRQLLRRLRGFQPVLSKESRRNSSGNRGCSEMACDFAEVI